MAPDGSPYVSKLELESTLVRKGLNLLTKDGEAIDFKPKTLEEVAKEMNLSHGEVEGLRAILRETEEEGIRLLLGDRPWDEIKQEIREAEDDDDKAAELAQRVATNMFTNLGRIATIERRRNRKIRDLLGKDRAKDFASRNVSPVSGTGFEELLGDVFD